jgi:uncharacterized LabA/DUF88 family protein
MVLTTPFASVDGRKRPPAHWWPFHTRFMGTNVYIDGFNLYNGAVKNTPFKWLDLGALCAALLPGHTIRKIRYFTAIVLNFQHDPQASARQDIYMRALSTIPNLTVHRNGWFTQYPVLRPQYPLAYVKGKRSPQKVQIEKIEEKRTDVDLAAYLLVDCFFGQFDKAAVISNDSDLVLPVETVRRLGKPIWVINPHRPEEMSSHLQQAASYHVRKINRSVLARCQFPPVIVDAQGRSITKPPSW